MEAALETHQNPRGDCNEGDYSHHRLPAAWRPIKTPEGIETSSRNYLLFPLRPWRPIKTPEGIETRRRCRTRIDLSTWRPIKTPEGIETPRHGWILSVFF